MSVCIILDCPAHIIAVKQDHGQPYITKYEESKSEELEVQSCIICGLECDEDKSNTTDESWRYLKSQA